ncbi:MAG: glycerophosphoryl diester phosphodiesterase [Alphaproteobacteria bacterium]|nr:MAG: glycerophosphoryl diester phosphodiesterase [Alphaproteobacteria bacterium]
MAASSAGRAAWIVERPIAHRGLHDATNGVYENTLSAARAAVAGGFHIEMDLHLSRDGRPVVFHDDTLDRLTALKGNVRARAMAELGAIAIAGTGDRIPSLDQLLETVDGRAGLVLELKGVDGADTGFAAEVARCLAGYGGPVALMSFDHWLVEDLHREASAYPLGLTAEGDDSRYAVHAAIAERCQVDFVSYGIADLPCRFVTEYRRTGRPVITWTIRSPADAARSAQYADQITFEGFDPRRPG